MDFIYFSIAVLAGISIGYLVRHLAGRNKTIDQKSFDELTTEKNNLEYEIRSLREKNTTLEDEARRHEESMTALTEKHTEAREKLSAAETRLENTGNQLQEIKKEKDELNAKAQLLQDDINKLNEEKSSLEARLESATEQNQDLKKKNEDLEIQQKELQQNLQNITGKLTGFQEQNKYLKDKLDTQKKELEDLGTQFKDQFKVLADGILEEKSKKFTEQNREGLKSLLDPLGENIKDFRKKVEETYDKESKERFSLNDRIKELMVLNNKISEEANNLTNALKSDTKKQGNWGEMILEHILENSGLRKNEEYFIQSTLRDEDGQTIRDENGRRLQPDVIIKYPDSRKVIIDSKVSLVAYDRYVNAEDSLQQEKALKDHIQSIRNHVDNLSSKNYQNYTDSLDFVMLFIPIEPAYLIAIREDHELWNHAYKKRILLISPTNLIAALKLLEDLWKREYQNQNAMEIADRGGKLYDKFQSFVSSLEAIGKHIDSSQKCYDQALKQLCSGRGNLLNQVEELKKLGAKAQKNLPKNLLELE
ncbi:MAG: DNA recombination protein RmuC [Bacteroidota bacterium]